MRRAFLLFILLGMALTVHAEDARPRYRLRVHSPQTFSETLEHPAKLRLSAYEEATYIEAADAEFWVRYAYDASYEQIALTFDKLRWMPRDRAEIDYNRWIALLVQRWIDTNPIDFASLTHLEFADIKADITPHDFDTDGQPEWILYLAKGTAELEYENNVVVQRVGDGYRVIPVPIAWYSDATRESWAGQRVGAGTFEDVNADGVDEWLFHRSTIATMPASGVFTNTFRNILGWRDGQLVELGPIEGDVYTENIDDDPAQEFVVRQSLTDNWGCGAQEIIVYNWDNARYTRFSSRYELSDCIARRAEEAMWNGHYEAAAELYDRFILTYRADYVRLWVGDTCSDVTLNAIIYEYFMLRRIIAYALLGDEVQVTALLNTLEPTCHFRELRAALLTLNTPDPETLCQMAYDYFAHQYRPDIDAVRTNFVPGVVVENFYDNGQSFEALHDYLWSQSTPEKAGCDIRVFGVNPTPIPTPSLTPYPPRPSLTPDTRPQEDIWRDYYCVSDAYLVSDFALVLEIALLGLETSEEYVDEGEMRYFRALALEVLDRPDEALAEYVTIIEAAPESAWGRLAALHVEAVDE